MSRYHVTIDFSAARLPDGVPREIPLNELDARLDELTYPIDREAVHRECGDDVLLYADGTEPMADVLERAGSEQFDSRDELVSELYSVLPVQAVGEPGQSEGEG